MRSGDIEESTHIWNFLSTLIGMNSAKDPCQQERYHYQLENPSP